MIHSIIALSLLSFAGCASETPGSAASSQEWPDPRAEEPAKWLTDFERATSTAGQSGRPILINFTGSDWCAPCMRLKAEVFATASFAEYVQDKLILFEADFPRQTPQPDELREQNRRMAEEFQVEGFPTLILLNSQGKELDRSVGYMPGGMSRFVRWIEDAVDNAEL